MVSILREVINFLSKELTVLLIATLPVIELRGAIPIGISLGMSPIHATIISFLGSMIPVPFILFMIRPIFNYLKKTERFRGLVQRLSNKSLKNKKKIQKYGTWGLVILVAIPLPGTGVWSGSLAAALLGIHFKWAFFSILLGNLLAAIATLTVSTGIFNIL